MNWEIVGSISALIASMATLLTLIYLAIQIRESNKLARSSSLQSVIDGYSNMATSHALDNSDHIRVYIEGHKDWEKLPIKDKTIFDFMLSQRILHFENILQHHVNGLIDDEHKTAWLSITCSHITTPGGKQWWVYVQNNFAISLVEEMNQFLLNNPSLPSIMETYAYQFEDRPFEKTA